MNSIGKSMSEAVARLRARPQQRREGYAFCPHDQFWFRPSYTEGKCPLCGAVAPGGAPPASRWQRMDRSWFGLAGLVLESVAMLILVLFMYYKG